MCTEGEGYVVEATQSEDWVGATSEGDRMRAFYPGESFTYRFDREGTFYLGVIMGDDEDGPEELITTLNGVQVGCAVADIAGGKALFSYTEPLTVKPGDALTFTTGYEVCYYRIYKLLFARRPIIPPPPEFAGFASRHNDDGNATLYWTTTTNVETGVVEYVLSTDATRSSACTYRGRNHRLDLTELEPGATYTARIHTSHDGREIVSPDFQFIAAAAIPPKTQPIDIPFAVTEPTAHDRNQWPCWQGVPFAQGAVDDLKDLHITTAAGNPVPSQTRVQCKWPDGSIKWAALSLLADTKKEKSTEYRLTTALGYIPTATDCATLSHTSSGWRLDTPQLQLEISSTGALRIAGRACRLELRDARLGTLVPGKPDSVTLTDNGPGRARLEWRGSLIAAGEITPWRYGLSAVISPTQKAVQLETELWFGDSTPVFSAVESLEFVLPVAADATATWDSARVELDSGSTISLRQHTEERASIAAEETTTLQHAPSALRIEEDSGSLTAGMPDFWRSCPSALQATQSELRIQALPPLAEDEFEPDREHPRFYHLFAWFDHGRYMVRAGQTIRAACWIHLDTEIPPATLAEWYDEPLRPEFASEYLCETGVLGRELFTPKTDLWSMYEDWFDKGFDALEQDRLANRSYGWMHLGDWWGERGKNYGNNEYDLAWGLGVQWFRCGRRDIFRRALEMARHITSVDSCRDALPFPYTATVWKHSCNHVGSVLDPEELSKTQTGQAFLDAFKGDLVAGAAMDPGGHLNLQGSWLMALLADDRWILESARRTCDWVASRTTITYDFIMEREGAWPIANMSTAYAMTGDQYYLNAARLMARRAIERQDEETGAWLHQPLPSETGGVAIIGGKTFAAGALCTGLLRYLEIEPEPRPDVRRMLVLYADWLMKEAWDHEVGGFYYITNSPIHIERGGQRNVSETGMNAETTLFAYEEAGEQRYLDFWREMMRGYFERPLSGMGKDFSQQVYSAVWGLDRARQFGVTEIAPLNED